MTQSIKTSSYLLDSTNKLSFLSFFIVVDLQCYVNFRYVAIVVWSPSCIQLFCNAMDYSPPMFSVHGISQARILGWVAISCSWGFSWPRDWTHNSGVGRQILYHWATREAQFQVYSIVIRGWVVFVFVFFFADYIPV